MRTLDCKGLSCPAPVLQTKEAIEQDQLKEIKILVDNEASKQNVCRFLESQGFNVRVDRDNGEYHIIGSLTRTPEQPEMDPKTKQDDKKKIVIMITTDRMGRGNDELGHKLLASFIGTLKEMGEELWRIVFVNNGVKLTVEGSPVLNELKGLESMGVSILVCGTCLSFFHILEKKLVGETTNMLDVVTSLQLADQVITI